MSSGTNKIKNKVGSNQIINNRTTEDIQAHFFFLKRDRENIVSKIPEMK